MTTATVLASRGLKVTLLEGSEHLGSGATARNGGQLSYCYVDSLAAPAILRDLPRLLAGRDPAFRIRASLSPEFLGWSVRFLGHCRTSCFVDNTRAVLRLALLSRSALAALVSQHPTLEFKHTRKGKLHIYDSEEKFALAKAAVHIKNELGCDQRVVSVDELLGLEPALSASGRSLVGAIYSPLDEAGDACQFTQGLAAIAAREHGLAVLTSTVADRFMLKGSRVCAVHTSRGLVEGDLFVLAAGANSRSIARTAGLRLPIAPMKGYSITLPATSRAPNVSITDTRAKIVVCRLADHVRVAGMAELGRVDNAVDSRRIDVLLDAAKRCLPQAAEWRADPISWSGLRPMTPDGRPIIGGTPISNLILNCGHGMLGWTLACGSAELLAALITKERRAPELSALADDFSFARF